LLPGQCTSAAARPLPGLPDGHITARIGDNRPVRRPGPVLLYTAARVGLFLATLVLLYVAGMRQLLLLLVAVLVSGILSYILLGRLRDQMSSSVVEHGQAFRSRMRSRTTAEDEADDARRAALGEDPPDAPAQPD
jgi:hypothetical protein